MRTGCLGRKGRLVKLMNPQTHNKPKTFSTLKTPNLDLKTQAPNSTKFSVRHPRTHGESEGSQPSLGRMSACSEASACAKASRELPEAASSPRPSAQRPGGVLLASVATWDAGIGVLRFRISMSVAPSQVHEGTKSESDLPHLHARCSEVRVLGFQGAVQPSQIPPQPNLEHS